MTCGCFYNYLQDMSLSDKYFPGYEKVRPAIFNQDGQRWRNLLLTLYR